jgi:nitroreductase
MDAIFRRRSIRKFTDQEVSDDQIRVILEAAQCAPHAGPIPSWRFYVIRDKQLLTSLAAMADYTSYLKDISCAIVVAGDMSVGAPEEFWAQECSAAAMNILNVVEEMELGAVWIGVFPIANEITFVKNNLGLPDNVTPLNIIPIGYPAKQPEPKVRYNEERVHFPIWDDVHGENKEEKRRQRRKIRGKDKNKED